MSKPQSTDQEHSAELPADSHSHQAMALTREQWQQAFRPILRFVGIFVVIIGLLSIPWPGVQQGYSDLFRKVAGTVFGSLGPRAVVLFFPLPIERSSSMDISMNVGDRTMVAKDGSLDTTPQVFSTRYVAYLPTVLLIALVLATPLPWRRRLWSLAGGLVLIHLFISFEILIMVANLANHTSWLTFIDLGPLGVKMVDGLYNIFIYQIAARFFVPVMIWILVSFRAGDLPQILGLAQQVSPPQTRPRGKAKNRIKTLRS